LDGFVKDARVARVWRVCGARVVCAWHALDILVEPALSLR